MKYLIFGLGNPGSEYEDTRHNIGFKILDALVRASNSVYSPVKYGQMAEIKHKGRTLKLYKPNTYMNLSGKCVQYHMQLEKAPLDHIMVVTDDLALPFGTIRFRGKGSDGGHNGLKDIQAKIGNKYPRLRFGIGKEFSQGEQVDYVLGKWSEFENKTLQERIDTSAEGIKTFSFGGVNEAMNQFNGK